MSTTPPAQDSDRFAGEWVCRFGPILAAVTASLICYLNVLPNDFCYDDVKVVKSDPRVNSPGQWKKIWGTDYWSNSDLANPNRDLLYRPVAISSYRLVASVFGVQAWPHHVVNILLHAIISGLVVLLCLRLGGSACAATIAGIAFAVMPIHSEVVAAVVGRADLLACLGGLLAILCHLRSVEAASSSGGWLWRFASAVAVFFALGAKESGASVVLLVPLFHFLVGSRPARADSGVAHSPADSAEAVGLLSFVRGCCQLSYLLVPLFAYVVLRYYALDGRLFQDPAVSKTVNVLVDAPWWQHSLGVIQLWGMYWAKTIYPDPLCINYAINEIRLAGSLINGFVLLGLATFAGLVVASVVSWRRGKRSVAVLTAAILICYLPVSNSLVLIQVFFAERAWYLPSVGVAVIAGILLVPLCRVRVMVWILAIVAIICAGRCWIRCADWRDNGTLYAATYRDLPDSITARYLYGQHLSSTGPVEYGAALLRSAIEIDFGFVDAHRALGAAYYRLGRLDEAVFHLQYAEAQMPGHATTQTFLESAKEALSQQQDETLTELIREAKSHPESLDRELAVVRMLTSLARMDEVLARFEQAEPRFGEIVKWRHERAASLATAGKRSAAIEEYHRCMEMSQSDERIAVELAMLLLERRGDGDVDEALRLSTAALELAPTSWMAWFCRAEVLVVQGRFDEARDAFKLAMQKVPSNSPQHQMMLRRFESIKP